MDDQPDENTKEVSMEELNVWNVEKLRKYLKYRGIAIANDARLVIGKFTMLLGYICHCVQLLCSTKEQDHAQIGARRKEKLFIDGISLPFPETVEKLENWLKGSYYFPDMTMSDMEAYLSKKMTGNP